MVKFHISVPGTNELFNFQVVNRGADKCEFEVYLGDQLVAAFEPNEDEYILICRNPCGRSN
jgi:hypothetical protein